MVSIFAIVFVVWFLVATSIFQRKFIKKYTNSAKERLFAIFSMVPYVLFLKKDEELTIWVIQIWASFLLFIAFAFLIK